MVLSSSLYSLYFSINLAKQSEVIFNANTINIYYFNLSTETYCKITRIRPYLFDYVYTLTLLYQSEQKYKLSTSATLTYFIELSKKLCYFQMEIKNPLFFNILINYLR